MTDIAPIAMWLIAMMAVPVAWVAGLVWRSVTQPSWSDDVAPDERLLAAILRQEHGS